MILNARVGTSDSNSPTMFDLQTHHFQHSSKPSLISYFFNFFRAPFACLCLLLSFQIVLSCFCKSIQASFVDTLTGINLNDVVCLQGGFDTLVSNGDSSKVYAFRQKQYIELDIEPNFQTSANAKDRRIKRKNSPEKSLCNEILTKVSTAFHLGNQLFFSDNGKNLIE